MRSLRVRFFLVVWPLVVAAMIILAFFLGSWTRIELQRVSTEVRGSQGQDTPLKPMIDAVRRAGDDSAAISAALRAITAGDTLLTGAAVVAPDGRVLGSSIPDLAPGMISIDSAGGATYSRTVEQKGVRGRVLMKLTTLRVDTAASARPRYLVPIPTAHTLVSAPEVSTEASFRALSRRILLAILVGSGLAALATALISRPLLGRVGELSRATMVLREGNLDTRVAADGSDELANLGRAFNELAEGLQTSEGQRRRMITDIAHELRTPLTNIIGSIETVKDGLRQPDARFIATLEEEAALLNRLVDDLRDLSLADAGELPLMPQSLIAGDEARRAVEAFPQGIGQQRIDLIVRDAALTIRADRERLGQVLRNLIQNARMYSPTDSTITVRVEPRDDKTVISVADQGMGIAPEHLAHVWDRFYRVDDSRTKETGGMGLGLALVARLVEAQGGEVGARSEVGRGSTFEVLLPKGQHG